MTLCLVSMAIRLQTPRSIINFHAVLSSLLEQIVYEVSQNQLEIVSTVDIQCLLKDIGTSHLGLVSFAEESAAIVSLLFAAWLSYQYVYNAKFSKLQHIHDYTKMKKTVRTAIFMLVFIFLRNVENAI